MMSCLIKQAVYERMCVCVCVCVGICSFRNTESAFKIKTYI